MPTNILNLPQYRALRVEESDHGYHLNGAILEWDDVEELHAGMNALARLNGEPT